MKKVALLGLVLCVLWAGGQAQSRRVPPGKGADKPNERPTAPAASPTPALVSAATEEAESDDEVQSVETRLVTIPVRVLDRKNRFIGGLVQENFKVFEDDLQQEIAYFTNEAQPFTVALVLDMSYSTTFRITEIQSAAISFIDQLRPEDKILVVSFDEEVHLLCEPTNDRNAIYRAIRSTRIATGTSLYDAVALTMNDRLRSIKGRKAIVLFTDGVDTTSRRSNDLQNLRDAMELDALIYPIRYDTFADVQSMKNKTIVDLPGTNVPIGIQTGTRTATANQKGTTAEEYKAAEEYLNQLADRTSGRLYLASTIGNLNSAFLKIASELREFYSLGYYPVKEGVPGKFHRIRVKVDQPNVAVRARDSYVVPKKRKLRTS